MGHRPPPPSKLRELAPQCHAGVPLLPQRSKRFQSKPTCCPSCSYCPLDHRAASRPFPSATCVAGTSSCDKPNCRLALRLTPNTGVYLPSPLGPAALWICSPCRIRPKEQACLRSSLQTEGVPIHQPGTQAWSSDYASSALLLLSKGHTRQT